MPQPGPRRRPRTGRRTRPPTTPSATPPPRRPATRSRRRVTGNMTGTTDEIIQWIACKWGIAEDVVRAQVAKESWWHQDTLGDFTTDASACAPKHPDRRRRPAGAVPGVGRADAGPHPVHAPVDRRRARPRRPTTWTSPTPSGATASRATRRGSTPSSGAGSTPRVTPGAASAAGSPAAGTRSRPTTTSPAVQDYLNRRIWTTSDFANG